MRARLTLCCALITVLAACRSPEHPESLIDFTTKYGTVFGTSTEAGILVLPEVVPEYEELPFTYYVGNSYFDDIADLDRRGRDLVVYRARSSRPRESRFAALPLAGDEQAFIESRNSDGEPGFIPAKLMDAGNRGNLLEIEHSDAAWVAQRYQGAGVYVLRNKQYQLAGVLNGYFSEAPPAVAFIDIGVAYRMVPTTKSYFERQSLPRRADFEYGVPRDIRGEKSLAAGAGEISQTPKDPEASGEATESSNPFEQDSKLFEDAETDSGKTEVKESADGDRDEE